MFTVLTAIPLGLTLGIVLTVSIVTVAQLLAWLSRILEPLLPDVGGEDVPPAEDHFIRAAGNSEHVDLSRQLADCGPRS